MARSRQFRRVSTDAQDTAKQVADLDEWDRSNGYDPGPAYVVEGESAFHGRQIAELERAVADLESGEYEVLVFWAADRMWRGESLAKALAYVERIHNAGGSVEFVKDAHLNVAKGVPAYIRNMLMAQAFGAAHGESQRKSERAKMDVRHHQRVGSVHGSPPFGYAIEGMKDAKRFVPTPEGREWIPRIYAWSLEGRSGAWIAKALTDAGVGGKKWSEGVVAHMIANPVYYGERRNGGNLETEGLVSFQEWQASGAAFASRRRGGRSAVRREPPLVRPICSACYGVERDGSNGLSVMYQFRNSTDRVPWYRCSGSGPQRKGCGCRMVPADVLDALVLEHYSSSRAPHRERTFVPGRNVAEELRALNREIAEAAARGDYGAVGVLSAKAADLSAADDVRPRWELRDTGTSKGAYFRALDREGRRAYIAEDIILAERLEDGAVILGEVIVGDDGGSVVSRWV